MIVARLWGGPHDGKRHRVDGVNDPNAAPTFIATDDAVYWLEPDTIGANQHGLHGRYSYDESRQGT